MVLHLKHSTVQPNIPTAGRVKGLKQTQAKTASKHGRQPGARGWTDEDKNILLQLVGVVLPISNKGWEEVGLQYNRSVQQNFRMKRKSGTLEKRFKAVSLMRSLVFLSFN